MVFKGSQVQVGKVVLEANLIPLDIVDLDVIRGMDWLARHHASVDYFQNEVVFRSFVVSDFDFNRKTVTKKGCAGYLAHVINTRDNIVKLEDIPIVQEFPDVFFDDLPRLPPSTTIAIYNLPHK